MEYFKLVMIINILAFCSFSGISGRNLPDLANDRFVSTTAPPLRTESASMTVSIRIMSFFPWTRNNLYQWFMTIPKGPYGGTNSSCKKLITETSLGRPASPSTQPSPQTPPGPRQVSNIESPLSMKPPQIPKGPYGSTDSSCKKHIIETNLGRPASPSTQPSPQAPIGPRQVSNIESPLSMKPPQIPKGPYGGTDSSCKKHIIETNLGRPASPSTQPSPQAPTGPKPVSNIESPLSMKPPQTQKGPYGGTDLSCKKLIIETNLGRPASPSTQPSPQTPPGPRQVSNIESPLSMKPPQIPKVPYGGTDSSCKMDITETNLGRPASPSTQPSPRTPPGPRQVFNIESPLSMKPPQIPKVPYGGTDSSCKMDITETNLGRPASPSTQPSPQTPPGPRQVSNIESPLSMKPPQIPKVPYGGTDSSCKMDITETNLGRPASPSTQPSPQTPPGPRQVSNIESPLSMKPPQTQKGPYGSTDLSCKKLIIETNLGRPASPSTQSSPQTPPGPRHVSNIESPLSMKPPQIPKVPYGGTDSSCKMDITETNLGRPASPSTQPSPQTPPGPRQVSNIESPLSMKPPQIPKVPYGGTDSSCKMDITETNLGRPASPSTQPSPQPSQIPKVPYGGTDSSCKMDITETNFGRPASPSTQLSPQTPPGPRQVSNIESPLSMKPPQIPKVPYGGTDSSCKMDITETNLGRPASPSMQPSPQTPPGPRQVSNIESPLSMKPPQIPKGPYGGTDSSCKKHITETNLGRPASPSTQPSPQAPPGPRHVSNIELPFSKKPPQKLNLESA